MTFVTLIICLLANHYWCRRRRLPVEVWFNGWYRWLERRSAPDTRRWQPRPGLFVVILCVVPLLPLGLLLWLLNGVLLELPLFVLHLLVLLHGLPRINMAELADDYLFRWRQGNYEAAYRYTEQKVPDVFERQPDDYSAMHQQFLDFVLTISFTRVFALLFCYSILGPVAALAYWLLDRTRAEATDLGVRQFAHGLTGLIEWIPVRAVALGFALAGDFVAGAGKLRERLFHEPANLANYALLRSCAVAAMGQPGEVMRDADYALRAAWELTALQELLIRTQVVWVIILTLIILVV